MSMEDSEDDDFFKVNIPTKTYGGIWKAKQDSINIIKKVKDSAEMKNETLPRRLAAVKAEQKLQEIKSDDILLREYTRKNSRFNKAPVCRHSISATVTQPEERDNKVVKAESFMEKEENTSLSEYEMMIQERISKRRKFFLSLEFGELKRELNETVSLEASRSTPVEKNKKRRKNEWNNNEIHRSERLKQKPLLDEVPSLIDSDFI